MNEEIDGLAEDFHVAPRKNRRRKGQCEAISTTRGRCSIGATRIRDGHKVCRYHAEADYPITYCVPLTNPR